MIFTLLAVIVVSVFFDSDLFYKCTCTSIIFWMLAGFMMKAVDEGEAADGKSEALNADIKQPTPEQPE